MNTLDWKVNEDSDNIKVGAIDLRSKVAENVYYKAFESEDSAANFLNSDRTHWRRQVLEKVELIFKKKIGGIVMEIGAGTGWCSALLSKEEETKQLYALDYDEFSVMKLMPLVFKNLKANIEKIVPVIGSYNRMKIEDSIIDYVISIGAIHHSENLQATFKEAYRVLKPGGILIASEHCCPNAYTIQEMHADNNELINSDRTVKLYGEALDVKTSDNSDHNYRLCEFEAFAYQAGFDVLSFVFDANGEPASDEIFKQPQIYKGYSHKVFFPYFAKDSSKPIYDNLLLILQKPEGGRTNKVFKNSVNEIQKPGILKRLFK